MNTPAQEFLRSAAVKSADMVHRRTIRTGIDHYEAAVERMGERFADWEAARQRMHEIKWEAVNHLDRYLLEFEEKVKARGGHVYWAETAGDARQYIADLAEKRGVKTVVKSKSMVTEEIDLTHTLEKKGVRVYETDLGELIVQLRNEPPYHLMTPAMHLTRTQIAELFQEKYGGVQSDDPEHLVDVARRELRKAFFAADMGVSGANFLVADTGMMALTTNGGNGRLGASVPRMHVAVPGLEKVIPRMEDLATIWPTLARSAVGIPVAVYNTLIGGPRSASEPDGPDEFHVVLLDNGRSELLADAEQREVLHCVRCGACLNVCPVFRKVGGHSYGTVYGGPIGSVLMPHLGGLKKYQHLSFASSLCGACTNTCPVKIDLHHHLLQNRRNAVGEGDRPARERMAFRLWRWVMMSEGRFTLLGGIGRALLRTAYALGLARTVMDPLRPWTKTHAAPQIPAKSFRAIWEEERGVS
jgi:L-lactate dehydrogenase complex protein LldF